MLHQGFQCIYYICEPMVNPDNMMERYVDLHIHSTASDGSMNPKDIIKYAKARNLSAISITDHDTVDGIGEALFEAQKEGVEFIPGVEISVDYSGEMHILGYFSHSNYINIKPTLDKLRKCRVERTPQIIDKLKELGIDIEMDEVLKEALGKIVGRPHIAKVLINKGYVASSEQAFSKYLSSGKTAYVKKERLSPKEGIECILRAGGVPILAHPKYLCSSLHDLDLELSRLSKFGLMGMEVYYTDHSKVEVGNYLRLAIKHSMLATGGSDFHGEFKPSIEMGIGRGGLKVPYIVFEKLKLAIENQSGL